MSSANVTRIQNTIFAAIEGAHDQSASLNDVIAALAAAEARYIASIPDRKVRRSLMRDLDAYRAHCVAEYLKVGGGPAVKVIVAPKVTN